MKIAIGIPSAGRQEILANTLRFIVRQTRPPDEIVVCVPVGEDCDLGETRQMPCPVKLLTAERGLCAQRNAILDSIDQADIVLFLDDDFLMAPSYVDETEKLFQKYPDVCICTGTVIEDGITGPGIAFSDGASLLDNEPPTHVVDDATAITPTYNGYGCNMAVRMSAAKTYGLRFDENLPFYGWLEDVDFSRQVARHGGVVRSKKLRGVHLGTKIGRTSGLRFGYSQVANPLYLIKKQTMSARHAGIQMGRNLVANLVKVWRPEPWIDRKGRLRGNLRALFDLARGNLSPLNVKRLE